MEFSEMKSIQSFQIYPSPYSKLLQRGTLQAFQAICELFGRSARLVKTNGSIAHNGWLRNWILSPRLVNITLKIITDIHMISGEMSYYNNPDWFNRNNIQTPIVGPKSIYGSKTPSMVPKFHNIVKFGLNESHMKDQDRGTLEKAFMNV